MLFTLDLLPFTLDPIYLQEIFGLTPLALHLTPYTFPLQILPHHRIQNLFLRFCKLSGFVYA